MKNVFSLLTPKHATSYINENDSIKSVLEAFNNNRFSVVPILNEKGEYKGTLSEGDLLRYITSTSSFNMEGTENISINQIERYREYRPLDSNATLLEVMALSLEQNFVPIIDDRGLYIGMIKRKEILSYLFEQKLEDK